MAHEVYQREDGTLGVRIRKLYGMHLIKKKRQKIL